MPMPLTDFVLFSGVGSSSRLLACSVEEATPPSIAPTLNRGRHDPAYSWVKASIARAKCARSAVSITPKTLRPAAPAVKREADRTWTY
jgi:hypothetical protein